MALSSPESPVPPRRVVINRTENPSEEHEELNKMAHGVVAESRSEDVFSSYACNSLNHRGIKHHLGDIGEAGCLAVSILLALLDNFARGRSRHIWFSISADLRLDAQRDLHDIGCFVKVIDGCQQLDKETRVFGLPADFKEGVVFSTYATLVSSVQKGANRQSRLQQLIDWCGGEQFNGCLIFDECHKAKHFVPGKEESSTKVALAVTTIQRMLPKARVVYCSATGVTDVKNVVGVE
ncbi:unnamed protein product [Porites lobata]|uniref:Strawberry notch AAA domain-containing protein n=1 Tax=Porites lobata TaxID=104759 RepID=A0ABN8S3V6_9CNID|nr:unnamed protein product [Porites lobata]